MGGYIYKRAVDHTFGAGVDLAVACLSAALAAAAVVAGCSGHASCVPVLATFAPMFVLVALTTAQRAFLAGAVFGTIVVGAGFAWLPFVLRRLQHASTWASIAGFSVLIVYESLKYGLLTLATAAALRQGGLSPGNQIQAAASVAACWVLAEWAIPVPIPHYVGASLTEATVPRQIADVVGVHGLGFFVVFVNALLATAYLNLQRVSISAASVPFAVAGFVVAAVMGYGWWTLRAHDGRLDPRMPIAVLQTALPANVYDVETANTAAWSQFKKLSAGIVTEDLALEVWPESGLQVYLAQNRVFRARLGRLAKTKQVPILIGALDQRADREELNTAYLIAPQQHAGADLHRYHKMKLVPFGEYVPQFASSLLEPYWRTTGDFASGTSHTLLPVKYTFTGADGQVSAQTQVAPSICFEAVLPGWFNKPVADGASVLVNLSDDSWFEGSFAARQHLAMTRLRAVETRRWLVRSSNFGISAFIDPSGEVRAWLPQRRVGSLVHEVELRDDITPYVRFGDWIIGLSAAIVAVQGALVLLARRRRGCPVRC